VKRAVQVKKNPSMRLMMFALLALAALAMPLSAFSQGCALCYTQAASTGARMIHALQNGILILVVPPTLGSIGMIFVMRRKDSQVRQNGEAEEPGQDW
jgi:hypothetical protein